MSIRDAFEKRFPVPEMLEYRSDQDAYELVSGWRGDEDQRSDYNSLYEGYQAAMLDQQAPVAEVDLEGRTAYVDPSVDKLPSYTKLYLEAPVKPELLSDDERAKLTNEIEYLRRQFDGEGVPKHLSELFDKTRDALIGLVAICQSVREDVNMKEQALRSHGNVVHHFLEYLAKAESVTSHYTTVTSVSGQLLESDVVDTPNDQGVGKAEGVDEVLGERCIDGGACHHSCEKRGRCFRRECCDPFSNYKEPWAYSDKHRAEEVADYLAKNPK